MRDQFERLMVESFIDDFEEAVAATLDARLSLDEDPDDRELIELFDNCNRHRIILRKMIAAALMGVSMAALGEKETLQ